MMKHIAFFIPSFHIGGIENVFITYANHLAALSYKVDFVVCKSEGALTNNISSQVNIVNLGNVKLRESFVSLHRYLRNKAPDIIISGGDYPNMVLLLASVGIKNRTKIVISQHNYLNVEVGKLGFWAKGTKWWMRLLYPFAHKIISVSNGIMDFLIKDIKVSPTKIVKIPNPIDIVEVKKKSREPITTSLPDNYLVFIGRLSIVKNLPLLLKAFDYADIPDLKLVIVGAGSEEIALKKMADSLKNKDNIIFKGAMSNPLPVLLHARALVLSSFSEAFPTILLEALCLDKPIASTPTKGALEILKGVNGTYLHTDFSDHRLFSEVIKKALEDFSSTPARTLRCSRYEVKEIISLFINQILTD